MAWWSAASGSRTERGQQDRRAPARSSFQVHSDPRALRQTLETIKTQLRECDPDIERRVELLVGVLVDEWLRHETPAEEPLELEIEILARAIRVEATVPDWSEDPEFWRRVGETSTLGIANRWGVDRRGTCGAWFEIDQ
jgi:hypothetical protein